MVHRHVSSLQLCVLFIYPFIYSFVFHHSCFSLQLRVLSLLLVAVAALLQVASSLPAADPAPVDSATLRRYLIFRKLSSSQPVRRYQKTTYHTATIRRRPSRNSHGR